MPLGLEPDDLDPDDVEGGSGDREQQSADTLPDIQTTEQTLKAAIGCVGIGVHTGQRVTVSLRPAPAGHGIVFHRKDLGLSIPAGFDQVIDTRLCTVVGLAENPAARVGTIEHLMAAIAAAGIDNLLVVVDGPELPILDGSAANWTFLFDCAGIETQDRPRQMVQVLRPVRVRQGDAWAALRPAMAPCLQLGISIDFAAPAIGQQKFGMVLSAGRFRAEIARARTFALAEEVAALHAAGLARGGSLDNAIVVDGATVLNPTGLRFNDEFARHKLLDAVGDLALAGGPLLARFTGHRSGHALNNLLLRTLFADPANWRLVPAASAAAGREWLPGHIARVAA